MEQNVKYYWIQELVNHSCPSHTICHCKSLHSFPTFASRTQIHVGNGHFVSVLFIIPIIIDIHRHRFEKYTLVSEIYENIDLVLGIKNIFKLEGVINSWDCCFNFWHRSLQLFSNRMHGIEAKRTEINKGRSTIYRWDIRTSYC